MQLGRGGGGGGGFSEYNTQHNIHTYYPTTF